MRERSHTQPGAFRRVGTSRAGDDAGQDPRRHGSAESEARLRHRRTSPPPNSSSLPSDRPPLSAAGRAQSHGSNARSALELGQPPQTVATSLAPRVSAMRVLVTGMSGTGKSSVVQHLDAAVLPPSTLTTTASAQPTQVAPRDGKRKPCSRSSTPTPTTSWWPSPDARANRWTSASTSRSS